MLWRLVLVRKAMLGQVMAGFGTGLVLTFVLTIGDPMNTTRSMSPGEAKASVFVPRFVLEGRLPADGESAETGTKVEAAWNPGLNSSTTKPTADELAEKVKVLIWVMTSPRTLSDRATTVKQTWGKRAKNLLFFSSVSNESFPTIGLNVSEGRDHLTAKTMQGFRYLYKHHFNDADWFMKVDDDTFVVMENLLYFLSEEDPNDLVYFGHHFGLVAAQGYNSGGGGYVLSKEALRRLGLVGHDSRLCRQDYGAEDAEFGKCMEHIGVSTVNTTDSKGRSRFHCFDPETHIDGGYPKWYRKYDANGARQGLDSVSDYAITFHYVYPFIMQRIEFYLYHLQAYGVSRAFQALNVPPGRRVPIKPIYRLPPYAPTNAPRPKQPPQTKV